MISIYTDGSSIGNPGPGGWGVVILDGEKKWEFSGGVATATNNQMELQAVIEALKVILQHGNIEILHDEGGTGLFAKEQQRETIDHAITIHTDSEYVQLGVEERLEKWIARGWRVQGRNKPIANIEQWQELYVLLKYFTSLSRQWVKGHAGNKYNEIVDDLARGEAEKC